MKKITLGVLLIAVVASGAGYYKYRQATSGFIALTDENLAALSAETAMQNEAAFFQPAPRGIQLQAPNADKNLYFGDLHVHSSLSFDSYLFGNRNDLASCLSNRWRAMMRYTLAVSYTHLRAHETS